VVSVPAHEASDIKVMILNPRCAYFLSKRTTSKTLNLGNTVNSGSAGGCKHRPIFGGFMVNTRTKKLWYSDLDSKIMTTK
jgi:hypothetical protein